MKEPAESSDTPAQQELEHRLAQLRNQMDDVPENQRDKLGPLWPALDALHAAIRDKRDDEFVRSVVSLAGAVIAIRREHKGDAHLAHLAVPPYDLWLPFKAASVAPSDRKGSPSLRSVWNDKIVAHVESMVEYAARASGAATLAPRGDSGARPDPPATPRP